VEHGLLPSRSVPSLLHELLVDLFRERPLLAKELLRARTGIALAGTTAEPGSIDLSQVIPTEYRTDWVTVLRGRARKPIAAVIAEVQLGYDDDKRRTWPVYVAAARARYRCPAILLVLTPDPAVARWASQPIELGHPRFVLQPIVISYPEVPRVCDPADARAAPELAVLSVMAHRDLETALAAVTGLTELPEDRKKLYWDVILSSLPKTVRKALEARVLDLKNYKYQSDFARKYYAQGRKEGHKKGHEKGREEGLRRAIVALVSTRLPELRDELEGRLGGRSEAELLQLITALGKARGKDRLIAAFGGQPRRGRRPSQTGAGRSAKTGTRRTQSR